MLYPCSHCGKDFSLPTPPVPTHGEKFECPHCGGVVTYYEPGKRPPVAKRVSDTQVVGGDSEGGHASSGAGRVGEVDRAVAAGLPAANGPEAEVLLIRPSAVRSQPLKFFGFALLGIAGLAGAVFGFGNSWSMFAWIPCGVGGLAAISVPVWMKLRSLNAKIRVTSKRIVDTDGFLDRRVSEVLHRDIRNVRVEQTFSQRIWRVGAIAVYTGGEEAPEIYMENVPDPHRVREVIDLYRPM
ncbi:MAG: PH domain-containing protein [Phycisphaerales bacterium]